VLVFVYIGSELGAIADKVILIYSFVCTLVYTQAPVIDVFLFPITHAKHETALQTDRFTNSKSRRCLEDFAA